MTGRDDIRAHPSVDELADLREGLLSATDEARVRSHLDGCADCAAGAAALDEVSTALRDAAPVAMPTAVARAIDDALREASADRQGEPAPPAREPVPTGSSSPRRPRHWVKPAFGWLAGAAAAVVLVGGIGAGLKSIGFNPNTDTSAADSGGVGAEARQPAPNQATGTGKTGGGVRIPPHVTEKNLRSFALAFSDRAVAPTSGSNEYDTNGSTTGGGSFARRCAAPPQTGGLKTAVTWHGHDALLVVRREARVASVYTCDATPRLLYSVPY